jgi:hypothetical protein
VDERTLTISVLNPYLAPNDSNARPVPGAVMSGFSLSLKGLSSLSRRSRGTPRLENPASIPSFEPAATVIVKGDCPYALTVSSAPSLLAAQITLMFRS